MLLQTLYNLSPNWKYLVFNFLFHSLGYEHFRILLLSFQGVLCPSSLTPIFFPPVGGNTLPLSGIFQHSALIKYFHLGAFLTIIVQHISNICPYLDEGIKTQRYVVIYLRSEQSHLKMSKVNMLVILGTCSDVSLGQNCQNTLLQNHREKSSLISYNSNFLCILNIHFKLSLVK